MTPVAMIGAITVFLEIFGATFGGKFVMPDVMFVAMFVASSLRQLLFFHSASPSGGCEA